MKAHLKKLADCRILVAGDLMLDRYWFGDVERISPEAPVPVVTVGETIERLGGAGNVAGNITSLGGQCTLLSVVGDDDAGARVLKIAEQNNIAPSLVTDRNAETTVKLRVLSRNQQLLRADFESAPPDAALDAFDARFAELLGEHQAVVLSDYGKGALARAQKIIALAAQKNIPVLVDPKGGDFAKYTGATLVTPNLKEFEQATAAMGAVKDDADIAAKAKKLMTQHNIAKILVTLSERGMILLSQSHAPMHRAARARQVYDVSGAGDSVIAVMAMAAAAQLDDDTALKFANSTAGVVVSKLGAATADLDELQTALARDYASEQ